MRCGMMQVLWRVAVPDYFSDAPHRAPLCGVKELSHHFSGQRLGCRTTDVGGPRQDRPSGVEADRSGV